jgi:carbon monoxide dehydrogenase subunit G
MKVSGSNRIEIAAAHEHCRVVLLDFDAYADWFPGVRESQAVAVGDESAGRLVFSAGVDVIPEVPCTLRYDLSVAGRLTPVVIEGSLRIGGPGWHLEAIEAERTVVSYTVEVEMAVPGGFLAERALSGHARRYLIEQPAEKLREHVERRTALG